MSRPSRYNVTITGGSTREIELIKVLQILIDKVNRGEYDPSSSVKTQISTKLGDIHVSRMSVSSSIFADLY